MQNSDSSRNSMIFWKGNKKFQFLHFFSKGGTLWCQNSENIFFNFSRFHNFFFQKQLYWDQTGTKINKVMNFGNSSHKTVEMPDCFRLCGPKRAPLSRNRVNGQHVSSFSFFLDCSLMDCKTISGLMYSQSTLARFSKHLLFHCKSPTIINSMDSHT